MMISSHQNLKPMTDLEKQMYSSVMQSPNLLEFIHLFECCLKHSPMIKKHVTCFSRSICAARKLMWEVALAVLPFFVFSLLTIKVFCLFVCLFFFPEPAACRNSRFQARDRNCAIAGT